MAKHPPTSRTRKVILHPEHREAARLQVTLITHHEQIIETLKRELVIQIERDYGVDLASGEWTLNVADGRLERVIAAPAVSP